MEYLKGYLAFSASTVTSLELRTPASRTEKMAMLIHQIILKHGEPSFIAGAITSHVHVIADESHEGDTDSPELGDDPSVLYRLDVWAQEGILAAVYARGKTGDTTINFDPPILYPKASIWIEGEITGAAGAGEMGVLIGYTLEKVSDTDFISALVE